MYLFRSRDKEEEEEEEEEEAGLARVEASER